MTKKEIIDAITKMEYFAKNPKVNKNVLLIVQKSIKNAKTKLRSIERENLYLEILPQIGFLRREIGNAYFPKPTENQCQTIEMLDKMLVSTLTNYDSQETILARNFALKQNLYFYFATPSNQNLININDFQLNECTLLLKRNGGGSGFGYIMRGLKFYLNNQFGTKIFASYNMWGIANDGGPDIIPYLIEITPHEIIKDYPVDIFWSSFFFNECIEITFSELEAGKADSQIMNYSLYEILPDGDADEIKLSFNSLKDRYTFLSALIIQDENYLK